MQLIEPINAIKSWEGYEYQGHIALYVTLKSIYELLNAKEDISKYELQIEGEEDFSIRKNGNYISLHQVKAGKVSLKDNDKFSFVIGVLENNAEIGYYHITNGKNIPSDFIEKTLSYIETLKTDLKRKLIYKKDLSCGDEKDYIVVENINNNHKKADIYNILKYVCEDIMDTEKIEKSLVCIDEELNNYKEQIKEAVEEKKKIDPNFNEDNVYVKTYAERFENSKVIRNEAYEVIRKIINIECPSYMIFADINYAALVYEQIFLLMKKRITEFHIEQKVEGKCILTYTELFAILKCDYHEKIDTIAYQYFQVLRSIRDAYEEYPAKKWNTCSCENCRLCINSEDCNLMKQIQLLISKKEEEREKVIYNLLLKTPQPGKSNNLPSDDTIAYLFLNILDEIKIMNLEKNNVFQATRDGKEFYRLSLNSSYDIVDFQKQLETEMKKNPDKSLLYDCDVLITDKLNNTAFFYNGSNISVLGAKELAEISYITTSTIDKIKKDCYKPKVIRIIDRDHLKGELK